MAAPKISNRVFIFILCVASVFVAYFVAKGVNVMLDPGTALPAKPTTADVSPEDLALMESGAPVVAMALAGREMPVFYVAAPLPDGTVVEFTLDAISDHVDPLPEHVLKVLVSLSAGVGKTPRMATHDKKPLPMGRYAVTVRHRDANLVEKTVFVGGDGAPTPEYLEAMKKHHAKLRGWAEMEARTVDEIAASVEKHLLKQKRGNLARWLELMQKTRAKIDRVREEHVPVFYERAFERLNKILRDADGVEKEWDRIAKLTKPNPDRDRIAALTSEVARAELAKLRASARAALEEQRDPARLFARATF